MKVEPKHLYPKPVVLNAVLGCLMLHLPLKYNCRSGRRGQIETSALNVFVSDLRRECI